MKFKFQCSAWSNVSYSRGKVVEIDITPEDWADMSFRHRQELTEEDLREWVNEDLSFDAEIIPEDLEKVNALLKERGEL